MPEINEGNTTLDALAGMVQRGFFGVDERFNEINKRFDLLEGEMNARFDQFLIFDI